MVAEPVADPSLLQSRPPALLADHPNPEMTERPTRRSFTVDYKLRILDEAATCAEARQVGALLRREGLYYSHLAKWRQQCAAGGRAALAQPRGRKPHEASTTELARVQQENVRLTRRLAMAEEIIAVQKKVAALLSLSEAIPASP
jgi:transposase-like protein